jgi:hypothetical protein
MYQPRTVFRGAGRGVTTGYMNVLTLHHVTCMSIIMNYEATKVYDSA